MGKSKVMQIGLDVHRKFSIASARDAEQRVVWRQRLEHSDRALLREQLGQWPKATPLIMEGTFGWGWMSDEVSGAGLHPHLASSRKVAAWRDARGIAKSNKIDADLLGELWDQKPRWWEVWLVPQPVRDQRELLRHRMGLVRIQTSVKNRIHATLRRHGIINEFSDLFGVKGRRFLQLLLEDRVRLRETARQTLKDQLILLDAVRRLIARATRQFRAGVLGSPEALRLTTLPGVSSILAYTIAAEVGRIERFRDGRHLASYSLLAPRADDSGEQRPGKPIGRKIGHAGRHTLQWAWIEAARGAVRKSARMRAIYDRRTDQGQRDRNRGYIAVANALSKIAYAMWTKEIDYQEAPPPRPGSPSDYDLNDGDEVTHDPVMNNEVNSMDFSRPGTGQPDHPMAACVE